MIGTLTPPTMVTSYRRRTASNALNTVVAPASNTKGIVCWRGGIAGGNCYGRIMAKSSAPGTIDDTAMNVWEFSDLDSDNLADKMNNFDNPVIVPAGLGIYEQCSHATNTSTVWLEYQVL